MTVLANEKNSKKPPVVIEAPNKVLVVDEMPARLDALYKSGVLQTKATYAKNGLVAIDWIVDNGPWDVIFLDHDLDTWVHDPYPREVTGRDVAQIITRQSWQPHLVVIHSMNSSGASNIENTLRSAGIKCMQIPIYQIGGLFCWG